MNSDRRLLLDPNETIDFKRYYAFGFLLNILPIYVFYPIRTGKTLQQANIGTSHPTSLASVVVERVKSEGVRGLYKGISVYGVGSISGRLVHFATYDALRERVYKGRGSTIGMSWLEGRDPALVNGILGTVSAVTTSSFMVPFDVISQKLQVSKNPLHTNMTRLDGSGTISTHSGSTVHGATSTATTNQYFHTSSFMKRPPLTTLGVIPQKPNTLTAPFKLTHINFISRLKPNDLPWYKFLYRGWTASILNTLSFFPAYFYTYTFTLDIFERNSPHFSFLSSSNFMTSIAAGCVAGMTGTFVSAPFDVVKTRIQIAREAGKGDLKWLNMARSILRTEGLPGLFVGISARMWIIVPLGSFNFWVFEKVREWSTVRIANTNIYWHHRHYNELTTYSSK